MNAKIAIVLAFVLAVGIILFFTLRSPGSSSDAADAAASAVASGAPSSPAGKSVEITFVYSTEKKAWVEDATASFSKEHPEIKVTLTGKGSIDAAQAMVDGELKPTLYSPADSMILSLFEADWTTKNSTKIVAESGDDAPPTLVISPLVFVAWEDRATALQKSMGGTINWKGLRKAISSNQGWPSVGGKAEWGFVKLGQTDPTRSNSGLQALLSMTLEFYGKTSGLKVDDLLKPDYQAYVKDIEKGVPKFEASTGTFMTDMVRFGPSKYDVSVVYENLALEQLESAQGRWGNLRVYYPATTIWSDHPIALLQADWVTPAQRDAARLFVAHLRSKPVQTKALSFGFRPGDPSVPVKTADAANPFTKLAPYGVLVDLPPAATPPDGVVARAMMTMWSRVAAPSK